MPCSQKAFFCSCLAYEDTLKYCYFCFGYLFVCSLLCALWAIRRATQKVAVCGV